MKNLSGVTASILAAATALSACGGGSAAPASTPTQASSASQSIAASPAASAKPLGGIAGSPQASGAATGNGTTAAAAKAAGDLSACPPRQPSLNLGGVLTEAFSPHPAENRFSTTLYARLMHTPLFGVDPLEENLNVDYGAVEWKYLPGASGLALTVRPNLTFNNGDPVDAEAVKFAIEAAGSEFADPQVSGTLKEVGIKDIKVQDPRHLQVDFKQADATFVLEFSPLVNPMYLLDPKAHSNGAITRQAFDDFKKNPIGSGPYDYSSGQAQQFITMKAARQDPVLGCPLYDTVTFKNIKETGTRMAELKTGQLDIAQADRDQLADLKNAKLSVLTKPGQNIIGLYFFMTYLPNTVTSDENFRAAVTYAIDWQSIASTIFKGVGVSPWGCTWPPSFDISSQDPRYEKACGTPYPYDPAKAKQFLAKSNYKGTPFYLLMWGNYPEETQVAQAMQPMIKAIGINAQIKQVTRTEEATLRNNDQEPNTMLFFGPGERVTSLSGSVSVWGADQHWGPKQDKDVQDALKKSASAATLEDYVNATVTLGQLVHDRFYGPGFFDAAAIWGAGAKVSDWGLSKSRGRTPLNLTALTTQAGKDERTAQGLK